MKNNTIKLLLIDFTNSSDKISEAFRNDKITKEEYSATYEALLENYDHKIKEQIRKGNI